MSSGLIPYEDYTLENLNISMSMKLSIILLSLCEFVIEQLPLYENFLIKSYCALNSYLSMIQQKTLVIGLLLRYLQVLHLPFMLDHATSILLHICAKNLPATIKDIAWWPSIEQYINRCPY